MSARALILGASGYGGGELIRLLSRHPEFEAVRGTSRQHAGKAFGAVHLGLRQMVEGSFEAEPDLEWLAGCDHPTLFAAMPHGALAERLPKLDLPDGTLIVDLSTDFRHQGDHGFCYSLPELQPPAPGKHIASPGCFATACALALAAVSRDSHAHISAVTGSSGSGAAEKPGTHHPTRAHDYRAYKMLEHQHEQELRELHPGAQFSLVTHSGPFVRGIFATCQFLSDDDLAERLSELYKGKRFIRLAEGSPRLAGVVGSPFADIGWTQKDDQCAIYVALDNLMKGMASQAIQSVNLAKGWPEESGLDHLSPFPI